MKRTLVTYPWWTEPARDSVKARSLLLRAWRCLGMALLCAALAAVSGLACARSYVCLGDPDSRVRQLLGNPNRIDRYPWFEVEIWVYGGTLVTMRNRVVYEYPADPHLRFYRDNTGQIVRKYVYPGGQEPFTLAKAQDKAKETGAEEPPEEAGAAPVPDTGPEPEPSPSASDATTSMTLPANPVALANLLMLLRRIALGTSGPAAEEPPATPPGAETPLKSSEPPLVAEDGSHYGQPSPDYPGQKKTVFIEGYFRPDGTYVKSHYRTPGQR